MRFSPKVVSGSEGIDAGLRPPYDFVTRPVHFAMMAAAQGDDEFVAHLSPKRGRLREPKMMRIRGLAPTDHAR
jgi:hypothetical protein